jgi:hypothetical protein
MIDLETFIEYLSSGPCIAWIGNGPSVDMGMKNWKSLANAFLELARKEQKSNFNHLEQYYQTNKLTSFFGEIKRGYGEEYLLENCRAILTEPEGEGKLYSAIVNLPFISYFTTNWDNLLYKHASKKKAWKLYQNDNASINSIDIATIPSIVKLHGSLEKGYEKTLIITDEQYSLFYEKGEKEYFQDFLKAYLITQRIVFIGYSLNDPEILAIQKRIREILEERYLQLHY